MDLEIKKRMADAYTAIAHDYGQQRNPKFDAFLAEQIRAFVANVGREGARILDVGSGPGNESMLLLEAGLNPVCVDNSVGMISECMRKGLEAYVMDFYDLAFPDHEFAAVWMAFSLLHVPKSQADIVLREAARVLQPSGIFYVSLFEGQGEGLREADVKKFGCQRYFSYYQPAELCRLLQNGFKVTHGYRLDLSPRPTISFICKKMPN